MILLRIFTGILGGLLAMGCSGPPEPHSISGPTMGSHYLVKVGALREGQTTDTLKVEIQSLLDQIEHVASTYQSDSELSRFNLAAPGVIPASDILRDLVTLALKACEQTDGALDVTIGPLVNLWGFGPGKAPEHRPSQHDIDAAQARVGCEQLAVSDGAVIKKTEIYVDLSSVTQGYAGEKVAELLDAKGIQSYLVDLSGELVGKGVKPDGTDWRIAVEVPILGDLLPGGGAESIQKIVTLKGKAIATSGDYRNFLDLDGELVNHIIDPKTGYPVQHGLASVTVMDDSLAWADALSTALMVMGPNAGYEFAASRNQPALFVVRTKTGFEEKMTPAFQAYVSGP